MSSLAFLSSSIPSYVVPANSALSLSSNRHSLCLPLPRKLSIPKRSYRFGSGSLSTFACSASPINGIIGFHVRNGNVSLLCFKLNPNAANEARKGDSSQVLSALLPFVVPATAIAALAQPFTFSWISRIQGVEAKEKGVRLTSASPKRSFPCKMTSFLACVLVLILI